MVHRAPFPLVAVALACLLSGCSAQPAVSDRDASALATLAEVAGPTSNVDRGAIASTECWIPSEHIVDDPSIDGNTTWKVLCRVHYTDSSGERYQDATCIGNFASDPMLDHCYRWSHYDFAPVFEDFSAVTAG
jgi:hypothetical protein